MLNTTDISTIIVASSLLLAGSVNARAGIVTFDNLVLSGKGSVTLTFGPLTLIAGPFTPSNQKRTKSMTQTYLIPTFEWKSAKAYFKAATFFVSNGGQVYSFQRDYKTSPEAIDIPTTGR